jgi:thiazole synthase
MTTTLEFPGTRVTPDEPLEIAGRTFRSRLFVGTGKYGTNREMVNTIRASGAEVVTVAVRRIDLDSSHEESILHYLDPGEFFLLPNTAGCYTAEEAVRYARLGREAGLKDWVKLEVIGDQDTLLPDNAQLLEATEQLVSDGFVVLPYTNDDLVTALRLEKLGAAAVMPLASPIGSGLGLLNPVSIRIMKQRLSVPVIVDAGVGTASDACVTMEQGVDGILMNTALAEAGQPEQMGHAMRLAVEAGRTAYLAGRMQKREWAAPSSPTEGRLD